MRLRVKMALATVGSEAIKEQISAFSGESLDAE
jgi:hypothetical protein